MVLQALHQQLKGGVPEIRREGPVVRCGGAAPLNVPEDDGPALQTRSGPDVICQLVSDTAQADRVGTARNAPADDHLPVLRPRAFGDGDDTEPLAPARAADNVLAHLRQVVRNLRDEDDISAAGNARMQGNPAGVSAHHLHDHHAMVRAGRSVNLVDGLGRRRHGRIEAERDIRAVQVVVDGLRHAHNRQPLLRQPGRHRHRAVTPDANQGLDLPLREHPQAIVRNVPVLEPAALRDREPEGVGNIARPQDRATDRQNVADVIVAQAVHAVLDQPEISVLNAPHLEPVLVDRGLHHGSNHGVQPGAVAPTRHYGNRSDSFPSH